MFALLGSKGKLLKGALKFLKKGKVLAIASGKKVRDVLAVGTRKAGVVAGNVVDQAQAALKASSTTTGVGAGALGDFGKAAKDLKRAAVAKGSASRFVHLTSRASKAEIIASGELRGARGIFALEREVAEGAGTAERVLRTGLSPENTKALVGIPEAASGQFARPWAIGPYSAWKRFGDVRFSKPGTIVLSPESVAGTFVPSPTLFGPRTLIYVPDMAGYVTATGVGVYLWTRDSRE